MVTFTVTREDSGTYSVEIAGLEGEFEIEEGPPGIRWWFILLIIAALAVLGLIFRIIAPKSKRKQATGTS
jgi:hypothetical protein